MKNVDRVIDLQKRINANMTELETMKARIDSEGREPTAEERKIALELMQKTTGLHTDLELEKQEIDLRSKLDKTASSPIKPEFTRDKDQEQYPGLPPKELRFKDLGEQLSAIVRASDPSQGIDRRLVRAASGIGTVASPGDGGFQVQQDFATEILRNAYESSPVVSRVRRIPIGPNSNRLLMNAVAESSRASTIWGGIQMYWLGEGDQKTPSYPTFRQIELSLKKVAGLYVATDELLQDSVALASVAAQGFAEALDVELEDVIINGNNTTQPDGILGHACVVTVTPTAATLQAEDVINMWARLHARSMPNAVWLINQALLPQVMTMNMNEENLWLPQSGLAGAPNGTIMGRPIFPIECAAAAGFEGDIILCDLNQYLMIEKGGPQFASSIHVRFVYDETSFRIVYRTDGEPAWAAPLTPKSGGDTVSPFVTLGDRSTT